MRMMLARSVQVAVMQLEVIAYADPHQPCIYQVGGGATPHETMHLVALGQEKPGEIGPVLTRDPRD
jgi:hypothetical protein